MHLSARVFWKKMLLYSPHHHAHHASFKNSSEFSGSNNNLNHPLNQNREREQVMLELWRYSTMVGDNFAHLKCLKMLPNCPIMWQFSNLITKKHVNILWIKIIPEKFFLLYSPPRGRICQNILTPPCTNILISLADLHIWESKLINHVNCCK